MELFDWFLDILLFASQRRGTGKDNGAFGRDRACSFEAQRHQLVASAVDLCGVGQAAASIDKQAHLTAREARPCQHPHLARGALTLSDHETDCGRIGKGAVLGSIRVAGNDHQIGAVPSVICREAECSHRRSGAAEQQ
jgi:hypothetical protein